MTVLKSLLPSGLLATIVGGIVGVYAGVLAGGPIADTFGPKKIDLRPLPTPAVHQANPEPVKLLG